MRGIKRAIVIISMALALSMFTLLLFTVQAHFIKSNVKGVEYVKEAKGDVGLVYLCAAIAVGVSCIAAALALRAVVTAGFAAITERPEVGSSILILGGLAEGIAIYGLLVAILILTAAH